MNYLFVAHFLCGGIPEYQVSGKTTPCITLFVFVILLVYFLERNFFTAITAGRR